jgi:hypothetical protein
MTEVMVAIRRTKRNERLPPFIVDDQSKEKRLERKLNAGRGRKSWEIEKEK